MGLDAFHDSQIPPLIASIRASSGYLPDLALVAVARRPGGPEIVGHVMVSRTDVVRDDGRAVPILLLSPLAVAPRDQRRGIGTALTRAALAIADRRDEPLMVVEGIPEYYPRFGFVRARSLGILPPEHLGDIDAPWMARPAPTWTSEVRGRVVYPPHFAALV